MCPIGIGISIILTFRQESTQLVGVPNDNIHKEPLPGASQARIQTAKPTRFEGAIAMLSVRGSTAFREQVEAALQSLAPSAQVNRRSGSVWLNTATCTDLGAPVQRRFPRGYRLLDGLIRSGYQITIVPGSGSRGGCGNRTVATYRGVIEAGGASGSTVYLNTGGWVRVPSSGSQGGSHATPPYITLGHELIHADQYRRQGFVTRQDLNEMDGHGTSPRLEHLAVGLPWRLVGRPQPETPPPGAVTENGLRDEHSLPRRSAVYGPTDMTCQPPP